MRRSKMLLMLAAFVAAAVVAPGSPRAQDTVPRDSHQMHELHQQPESYIAALEDPARDAYQKPHEVLTALQIKPGETIADIGAGSGYFTFRFSHFLGPKGRIYAVDVSPEMILHINRRVRELKLTNIISLLADADDPLLADRSIDRFFFCDSWHHIRNQTRYLALLKRMLRPGGQVVVIDFHKKNDPVGPPMEMRIARGDLVRQMDQNGFRILKEHTFLPYQYFIVFAPK